MSSEYVTSFSRTPTALGQTIEVQEKASKRMAKSGEEGINATVAANGGARAG